MSSSQSITQPVNSGNSNGSHGKSLASKLTWWKKSKSKLHKLLVGDNGDLSTSRHNSFDMEAERI